MKGKFQSFMTLSTTSMFSEIRKMNVGICAAHQFLHKLDRDIRSAVLGNTGTLISFRIGAEDASFLAREFRPAFDDVDLINLPNYDMYTKLMIDCGPPGHSAQQHFSPTT